MDNRSLVESCNELACLFYKSQGYERGPEFKFYEATHPHERGCWVMATMAYEHINGDSVEEALEGITEEEN